MTDLIHQVESLARELGHKRVLSVQVQLGELAGISSEHLREHFTRETRGTLLEKARLEITMCDGLSGRGQNLVLESVELEE